MSYIKAPKPEQQEMYDYLEELRQSGDTNMYGASPYLAAEFDLDATEARAICIDWMNGHDDPSRKLEENTTGKQSGHFFTTYEPAEDL
jgi:hypothetical protein